MNAGLSRRTLLAGAGAGLAAAGLSDPAVARATTGVDVGRPPAPQESLLFQAGHDGLAVFHVFGLAATAEGTVFAFAEGRLQAQDAAPHHLAMRRSRDAGSTWDDIVYVRESNGTQSFVNPTPLVDTATGRLHLFFAECFRDPGNTTGSPDSSRLYVMATDDE